MNKDFGPQGKQFFEQIMEEFRIDDTAGLTLLRTAARCLDRIAQAEAAIGRDGAVIKDRWGTPKVHPACALERDARNGFLAAVRALHLDVEPLHDRPGRPPGPQSALEKQINAERRRAARAQ